MRELREKFLKSSKKVIADKAKFPEETVKEVEERLKLAGIRIYKGLKRIDKGRLGIPIYLSLYDIDGQKITGNFKQMGKGSTETLSQASALMELVERFSLFSFYKEIQKRGILSTFEELKEKAIPFNEILKSVEDEESEDIKKLAIKYLKEVPFYFVKAFEVTTQKEKFIPFHWFWLLYEYNGSAGGNTYPEASVQAICELIERHTNALSVRKNAPMPAIKRDSIQGEGEKLINCYERLNIKLWIRDMTFGMPVPTVAVMAMDPSTYPERSEIVYAAGTATSPERALIRALTEVAQLAGDFDTEGKYVESGLPKFKTLEEAKNVIKWTYQVDLKDLPNISSEDHVEEMLNLSQKLKEIGYEVYLIDITHPQLNIPAVYAIIPGVLFRERTRISYLYQIVRTLNLYLPREKMKELLLSLLKEIKDKYYLWAYLGNIYKEIGRENEAIDCYQKALEFFPPPADKLAIISHLADAYFRKGEYEKVLNLVEIALEIDEIPELYNILGRAYYKLGNYLKAMEAFSRAIDLNPASAVDYANIGYCLKAINYLPVAQIYFKKALEIDPELTMAKRGLEYCERILNSKN